MTWTFVVGSIFTLTLKPRTAVCRLAVDMGPCRDSFNRWYFDVERSTCLPFVYGGCAGNMNRFKTYDTCINFCSAAIDAARSSPPTGFSLFSLEYLRCLVSSSSDPPANSATFPLIFRLFIPLQVRETTKLMSDLWKSQPEQVSTFRKIPILALPHCPSAVAFSVLTALKGKTFTFFIGFRSNFHHLIAHEIFYILSFGSKSIRVTVWLKRRSTFSAICCEITETLIFKNLNFQVEVD